MVVVAHLPKPLAIALAERESRARLENAHEFGEVRRGLRALHKHKQVQMVGHEAIGMDDKTVPPRTVKEAVTHHFRSRYVRQKILAQIATNGDEVGFDADVRLRRQAGLFSVSGHS